MSRTRSLPPKAKVMNSGAGPASPIQRLRALGRLPAGTMNKTEQAYAASLDARRVAGGVLWWKFEGVKLRLGRNCFLTVDFSVMAADGTLEMIDVKGAQAVFQDDAKAKIRVAASQYPFVFKVAIPRKSGGFEEITID